MQQTPPGGIMEVVANPLEKNQVGKEEEVSCRSLLFLSGTKEVRRSCSHG
jgi:hypothetical protein